MHGYTTLPLKSTYCKNYSKKRYIHFNYSKQIPSISKYFYERQNEKATTNRLLEIQTPNPHPWLMMRPEFIQQQNRFPGTKT